MVVVEGEVAKPGMHAELPELEEKKEKESRCCICFACDARAACFQIY